MIRSLINEEFLLIISLALCFLMVVLATYAGFSSALGAFVMGSILAETTSAEKIEHLTKSIKNLFGAIFFISVGMLIDPGMLLKHIIPIFAATLVLLFGKPLFVMLGTLAAGQPARIAVRCGMSLSQIGEFSFIIAALGLQLNVISEFLYPVAVAVSVVTTFFTPYMIRLSHPVTNHLDTILPVRWKTALKNYDSDAQHITGSGDWQRLLISFVINVVVFSVIIIAIILLGTGYLERLFAGYKWHKISTTVITLAILSPFLWALAFRRPYLRAYAKVWGRASRRGPLILLRLLRVVLALFFVVYLFNKMYTPIVVFWGVIIVCIILVLFFKKLKTFYWKIESRFISNYNERESEGINPDIILTPWNMHIARFELSPQSPYVGKTLAETKMREDFGVNIVRIERGDFVIPIPNRDNHLYPNDKISVIGDDEQLNNFKKFLDLPSVGLGKERPKHSVALHHFKIRQHAILAGQSIRNSGIRERSRGLIIGIERNGEHIVNPESDLVFEPQDKVWIVGNEHYLKVVLKELQSPAALSD